MQSRRTSTPNQKVTKKFHERYGEHLVCVRYRYDELRRKRGATVETIVEAYGWSPPEKPEIVRSRVECLETELQPRVKQPGDKWNSAKRVREIHYGQAVALGLKKRIAKRWVVERTFAWLSFHRRMSKDYEYLPETIEALIRIAMIRLMLAGLT